MPLEVPALPPLAVPADARAERLLLDVARLGASGRFCSRSLLLALAWPPGQRVNLTIGIETVVIGTCAAGRHAVGSRGELTLPIAARTLAGLLPDLKNHPHGPLADLIRVLPRCWHDSYLRKVESLQRTRGGSLPEMLGGLQVGNGHPKLCQQPSRLEDAL